jgi:hypothetical protein
MKTLLSVPVLLLLVTAGSAGAQEFLISYWHGPPPSEERFAEIAEANFNVAMCGGGKRALDLAEKNGLKVLLQDGRITARNFQQEGFEKNLDAVVADYAEHPALWGYFVTDEPNASQFENLGAINRYLLKKDPKHIPFINLFPTYASREQLGNPTYEEHVASFIQTVHPRLLSYDHYALVGDSLRPDYFENMEIIRRQALKHKIPFNFILLSVPHFSYRNPTEADLRWQVNTALAYGARGIMYFTYSSLPDNEHYSGWGDAIIARDGSRTAKYDQVKRINGELKRLAPTLMRLTSTAVYHTPPLPRGTTALPQSDLVADVRGGELVVGHFRSEQGKHYMMFVNRSPHVAADATIAFSREVRLEELDRTTGRNRAVALQEEGPRLVWEVHFEPGEARLVKVGQRP